MTAEPTFPAAAQQLFVRYLRVEDQMSQQLKIGVLGLTHDHVWSNLQDAVEHGGIAIVAAADPHQALLGRAESEFHARPYTNYQTLLDSEQLDAVYIFADNAAGPELTEMAASRGLHVLIEKPMAASVAGAQRMVNAADQAGTRLMVNWPFAWWPQMQHAIRIVQEGAVGQLWQVRYRAAHAGPKELGCSDFFCDWLFDPQRNGPGGAFIDYCCYGAVLAGVLMGVPEEVTAVGGCLVKDHKDVDDNAVLLMRYPHGLAVSEGSWSQIGNLTAYATVIYGTTGTIMIEPRDGGRLVRATAGDPEGETIEVPPADPSMATASAHFAACVQSGEPFWSLCHHEHGLAAQRMLAAGAESLREKRTVAVA